MSPNANNVTLSGLVFLPGGKSSSSAGTLGAGARDLGAAGLTRRCVS